MGFKNSVIGGAAALIRSAIKSPNYVPDTAGWQIAKDGTSEFSNTKIRGTFQAGSTAAGHVTIDDTGVNVYDAGAFLRVRIPANSLSAAQIRVDGTVAMDQLLICTDPLTVGSPPSTPSLLIYNSSTSPPVTRVQTLKNGAVDGAIEFSAINVAIATPVKLLNGLFLLPWGMLALPLQSLAVTTGVVSPNELKDVLGDLTFTAVTGRAYEIYYDARVRSTVANTTADLNIRGAPGASPTTASAILAAVSVPLILANGPGATNGTVIKTITCPTDIAAGSWTIAGFYKCTAGGGSVNVDSAGSQPRELYVRDVGLGG